METKIKNKHYILVYKDTISQKKNFILKNIINRKKKENVN